MSERRTFYEVERERLVGEIAKVLLSYCGCAHLSDYFATQGVEQLLSSSNDLNRTHDDSLGMMREYRNLAQLWGSFQGLAKTQKPADDDEMGSTDGGIPGTGGHIVSSYE